MTTFFRALLIASTVGFAFVYWMPFFDSSFYSEKARSLLSHDGLGAWFEPGAVFTSVVFILGVGLPVLMYFFISWARTAFLIMCAGYPLVNLSLGFRVMTPIEGVFSEWIALADGAILAIAYFTSVASRFERAPQQKQAASGV
jgi:phosphoglycerol transferase MdoB-like AlkP superfamily enzyme